MTDGARSDITGMLLDLREAKSPGAIDLLAGALYPELHRLASNLMRRERAGHTLQPTVLVDEAFLRLVDATRIDWQDRAHFLGIAAKVMRRILVDHARQHVAVKRGQDPQRVTFAEHLGHGVAPSMDVLALHDALERLGALDPRATQVVELRFFGGLTVEETARVLGVSKRTVDNDWAMARMWLARELSGVWSTMASESYDRIKAIVPAVLQLPASARAAYLDQACAGDAALRAEVESLLAHDAEADGHLVPAGAARFITPTLLTRLTAEPGVASPTIGNYTIRGVLASKVSGMRDKSVTGGDTPTATTPIKPATGLDATPVIAHGSQSAIGALTH